MMLNILFISLKWINSWLKRDTIKVGDTINWICMIYEKILMIITRLTFILVGLKNQMVQQKIKYLYNVCKLFAVDG